MAATETNIYVWTDADERVYAHLRHAGGHWRLEWGYRDPPASDNYDQIGEFESSVRDDVVRRMLRQVRAFSSDPGEVDRVEARLAAAIKDLQG